MIRKKSSKIAHELIGILFFSLFMALVFMNIIIECSVIIIRKSRLQSKMVLTDEMMYSLEEGIFSVSIIMTAAFFVILFLVLVGIKLSYIETVTKGVYALSMGDKDYRIIPEGNNELTKLAEAINYLSETQTALRNKEERIQKEKEQFIRTLSHDIRTPLTAILSYSEYLLTVNEWEPKKQRDHILFMQKKAERIKELTDVLLDGGKRSPEKFENAGLLWEQLILEFEEELEDEFKIQTDISKGREFEGTFDVRELQRIFENLASNIKKYADPGYPVELTLIKEEKSLILKQKNRILQESKNQESHQIGITSIKRIVYHYQGDVAVEKKDDDFTISIILSEF